MPATSFATTIICESNNLGSFADSELWRISLRVAALSDVDYGHFIATLRESVEPVLRAYDTRDAVAQRS